MDYHLTRAAMAALFFFFGYQKWFQYETKVMGVTEWILGALILAGFWSRKLGLAGEIGSTAILAAMATCIPFTPVAHVVEDVILLAMSVYLVMEDAKRSLQSSQH